MTSARSHHVAAQLANNSILLVGGIDGASNLASAEIFYPDSSAFVPLVSQISTAAANPTATVLSTGKVFIAGGYANLGNGIVSSITADLFDPTQMQFSRTSDMSAARSGHTATLLGNDQVFLFGGTSASDSAKTAEVYDSNIGSFQVIPHSSGGSRQWHTATLLPNGKVILAGGISSSTIEAYDPATQTFAFVGDMNSTRYLHTATLLPNGTVLIAGGYNGMTALRTLGIYDPRQGTFTQLAAQMIVPRYGHTATLTPDGQRVVIAGGVNTNNATNMVEVYEIATRTLSVLAPETMHDFRVAHTATVLSATHILMTGGNTRFYPPAYPPALASAEIIDLGEAAEVHLLRITSLARSRDTVGTMTMQGYAVPNYSVRIEGAYSPAGPFGFVGSADTDADGFFTWADTLGTKGVPRFTRAVIP
ncbi:MAG: Kelch repeat-containing protein [Chthoniobacterales bacterium]